MADAKLNRAQKRADTSPVVNELAELLREWIDADPANRSAAELARLSGLHVNTVYGLMRRTPPVGGPSRMTVDALISVVGQADRVRAAAEQGRSPRRRSRTPFALLLDRRLSELKITGAEAARRAGITRAGMSRLAAGKTERPTRKTIFGLAEALQVDPELIEESLRQSRGGTKYELPPRVDRLSPEAWRALMAHMDTLLSIEERGMSAR